MIKFIKFITSMFTNTCRCGAKATKYPHGVPCCDDCACAPDCMSWLGDECDCKKE